MVLLIVDAYAELDYFGEISPGIPIQERAIAEHFDDNIVKDVISNTVRGNNYDYEVVFSDDSSVYINTYRVKRGKYLIEELD